MTVIQIADAAAAAVEELPSGLLIDGEWVPARNGATFDVEDPATRATLATIADATAQDALDALDAAEAAQSGWAATAPRDRSELLRRSFDAVRAQRERLATLISLEMGKPVAEARAEVDYGAEFLRWFSEEAVRLEGDYRLAPNGDARILVTRQPVGPCLLITPWNFPFAMATRKIAPAFAAGCTAILKPAAQAPLTSLAFAEILLEAGLPPGALSVITTTKAATVADPLLDDGRIRKLSFTGSTAVGRHLISRCGPQVIRASMELGGNAPFMVFADADLDAAVEGAMQAKMRNMGEACTAANRLLVEAPIAEAFAERLTTRIGSLRLGHGLSADTDVGPLIDAAAQQHLTTLVEDAVARGARVRVGGAVADAPGWFFTPTVLDHVPADARVATEEIFGPVAPIISFADEAEAIGLANGTEYGLVAYVYTSAIERALRVADALQVGMVALNRGLVSNAAAPFGGVKHSGLGREGGREGIDDYLDVKYLSIGL